MAEVFAFLSAVGVYPALVLLWMKMDAAEKAHQEVLTWLEKNCPNCGAVRIISGR